MASTKRAIGLCDVCGWSYPLRDLRKNSYGSLVCPTDYEGAFDLKNHPQNFIKGKPDNESIRNARPDPNNDRGLNWEDTTANWEDLDQFWPNISKGDL